MVYFAAHFIKPISYLTISPSRLHNSPGRTTIPLYPCTYLRSYDRLFPLPHCLRSIDDDEQQTTNLLLIDTSLTKKKDRDLNQHKSLDCRCGIKVKEITLSPCLGLLSLWNLALCVFHLLTVQRRMSKDAICSAVDVMQAMASSICSLVTKVNETALNKDLDNSWEVLAEPIQTICIWSHIEMVSLQYWKI
ncbi:Protein of unknown function DUF566, partial [Cynara cardunculus var. scolymus]